MPVRSGTIGGPACVPSSTTSSFAPVFPAGRYAAADAPAGHAASPAAAASPPAPASTERRLTRPWAETATSDGSRLAQVSDDAHRMHIYPDLLSPEIFQHP